MKEIGIGLLGFGTVGAGVVRGLQENGDVLAARLGVKPVLRGIADIDIKTDRGVSIDPAILTTDAGLVIDNPNIQIVIELIGGTSVAKDFIVRALERGKPVVTANKALLAGHGERIFGLACEKNVDIYFGASVGGGIPIVRALREGLIGNRIKSIIGILNGTCNYILTRMEQEHLHFEDVLQAAQAEGYAEADPSLDIDGLDTAHKATILASLAYGTMLPLDSVYVEGIRGISDADIEYAHDCGYRIKLLAVIKYRDDKSRSIDVRVHPALVPLHHVLASVSGAYNAVMVRGDLSGDTLYYGRGAGREPTARAVIGDVADVVRNLVGNSPCRVPPIPAFGSKVSLCSMEDVETRYYLRLLLHDSPGVFARIASVLGAHGISIASILQKEGRVGEYVPIVIVTHNAFERDLNAALAEIGSMNVVGAETVRIRIQE
ncbi:MAG: homoserine dehydrogenase [Lentisphaerae bacterium]|nr:homoserine dehydrogenase [Lentisphaerota bacterium]